MKVKRLKGNWREALRHVLSELMKTNDSIALFRNEDPKHGYQIARYLLKAIDCRQVKLGHLNHGRYLFQDILSEIPPQSPRIKVNVIAHTCIELIVQKAEQSFKNEVVIVVDCCQYLNSYYMCFLLGLVSETRMKIKFLFVFESFDGDKMESMISSNNPVTRLFFHSVNSVYKIDY